MANVPKNGRRAELDQIIQGINALNLQANHGPVQSGAIGNGGTAGRLRTTAAITFAVAGRKYVKASTDDLWNLSAQTDTIAAQRRAFWLYLDASGTATIAAGTNAGNTDALALAALPAIDLTKSVIGVFVAGPLTNFDDAGGLAAQGTIYDGIPSAALTRYNKNVQAPLPIVSTGP